MSKFAWFASLWKPVLAEEPNFRDISQLRTFVVDVLRLQIENVKNIELDKNDLAKFSANINGEVSDFDLTNLFALFKSYPETNPHDEVARFINGLGQLQRAVTLDNLVVVIRTQDYVDYINKRFNNAVAEHLLGELNVVYMADGADAMSPIKNTEMMGKTLPELRKIAIKNILKWLPKIKVDDSIKPIMLYYVDENTMLSCSLILVDDFWTIVEKALSTDVYFTMPRKDQLFLLDAKHQDALPALGKLIEYTDQDGFNLLSNQIYRRRNGKFEIVAN
jgi:uncharacterized protein YtpQ (UPF0354 family)